MTIQAVAACHAQTMPGRDQKNKEASMRTRASAMLVSMPTLVIMSILVILLFMHRVVCWFQCVRSRCKPEAGNHVAEVAEYASTQVRRAAKKSVVPLKICISFYQVVTQMASVYRTSEPPPYHKLLSFIESLINWVPYLDLKAWAGFGNLLENRLWIVCLIPPALIIPAFLVAVGMQLYAKRRLHPSDAQGIEGLRQAFVSAWIAILPPVVWLAFFISVPISSFAFLAVRECDCFWLYDDVGTSNETICFSTADYSLRCPASAGSYQYLHTLASTCMPSACRPFLQAYYCTAAGTSRDLSIPHASAKPYPSSIPSVATDSTQRSYL